MREFFSEVVVVALELVVVLVRRVEDLPDGRLSQAFPTDPQNMFGTAMSIRIPPLPADPTHPQVGVG